MESIHISLAAEKITEWAGIPITNTLVTSWVVILVLLILGLVVGKNPKLIPGKLQLFFESIFSYVLGLMEETLEDKKLAQKFFPLIATIFLFIFTSNLLEFIPGVGSIGFFHGEGGEHTEFTPLFRSVNTDFNVTIALALISFFTIEIAGIAVLGLLKYSQKFVNFKAGVMGFFIGILELVSEIARLISFSFRLFGNIFAGEVLIGVMLFFLPYVAPVPLMLYEVFVGFIQAVIFSILTLFFLKIAITDAHEAH